MQVDRKHHVRREELPAVHAAALAEPEGDGNLSTRKATPLPPKAKAQEKEDSLDPKIKWLIVALLVVGVSAIAAGFVFGLARLNPGVAKSLKLDGLSTSALKAVEYSGNLGGLACLLGAGFVYYKYVSWPKYKKAVTEIQLQSLFSNKAFQPLVEGLDINHEIELAKNKNPNLSEVPGRLQKLGPACKQYDEISASLRAVIVQFLGLSDHLSDNIIIRQPEKIPLQSAEEKNELEEAMRVLNEIPLEIAEKIKTMNETHLKPFKQQILDFLFSESEPRLTTIETILREYREDVERINAIVARYRASQETYIRIVSPHLMESLA